MAQVLLSRILERKESISADRIPDLFAVLGDGMDEFARQIPQLPGSPPTLYGDAIEIFRLIQNLKAPKRMEMLTELFANASSLSWLNRIVKDAIVGRGFAGFRVESNEQRLLTEEEFERIRVLFLERLGRADAADLKEIPYFLSLMYGWHWAGGGKEARAWVSREASDSARFADLLRRMMSKKSMSYGNGTKDDYYLARQTLKVFFGSVESVEMRLDDMRHKESLSEELRMEARRLLSSIERESQE
ncbi:MAG: hypothetical protein F4Y03_17225 [Alphaproteobacteria bacterium]|nr:hypothetical protein [Alphaproteobacteria bacterium]